MTDQYCEAFVRLMALCYALGIRNINQLPGCWDHQIDDNWWVNGSKDIPVACSRGPLVEPFDCYVEFNGFQAGSFNPRGGVFSAGAVANERTFVEAVKQATERADEFNTSPR